MNPKTLRYIVKRLILGVFTVWVVITLTFFIMHAVPGGPFLSEKAVSQAAQAAMEAKYGLDKPLMVQYTTYLTDVVQFRFGPSLKQRGRMVIDIMGDGLKVIGSEEGIKKVSDLLGNKSSELEKPNLIPVFIGIGLGLILGAVPISFPVMGNAIHFGLAAGPLILGIIIGHFGPKWKISTYTSTSSLRMVREIGLCLLLSTVGLGAGGAFIPSLASNGLRIMLYSAIIAFVPMLITGLVARLALKQNFYTICGLLSGATTNPVALDFSSQAYRNIHPGVAYAAVYPFALFLQILSAQLLILLCV